MIAHTEFTFRQSAVVPFVVKNGEVEILLVSSRSGKRWVIPKGLIEPDLTPLESAVKEAYEEGGITGKAYGKAIGEYQYRKWHGICNVVVFLLHVKKELTDWPEAYYRQRKWLRVNAAVKRVEEKDLKRILQSVPKLIDSLSIK